MESMYKIYKRTKFIIPLIFLFAIVLFSKITKAANAYFVWESFDIYIPAGQSLSNYEDSYSVSFYVDGVKSDDYVVVKGVDYTSLSTVTTSRVGTYEVIYLAYSTTYNIKSKQRIYFHVIDDIPPIIELLEDTYTLEYKSAYDFSNMYRVSDNHSSKNNIKIEYDLSKAILTKCGTYECYIVATDEYNNKSTAKFNLTIVDTKKPNITLKKELNYSIGDNFNLLDYFTINDEYTSYEDLIINYTKIDYSTVGSYDFTLEVIDSSGNKAIFERTFNVIDGKSPEIKLKEYDLTLDICNYSSYKENFFLENIESITDDFDTDLYVEVDYSSLKKEIGNYYVYYITRDKSNNYSAETLVCHLKEIIPPVILTYDCNIIKNSNYNISDYFKVYDYYDRKLPCKVEVIYNDIDTKTCGKYKVIIRAYNSSGIFTTKELICYVSEPSGFLSYKTLIIRIGIVILSDVGFLIITKRKNLLS